MNYGSPGTRLRESIFCRGVKLMLNWYERQGGTQCSEEALWCLQADSRLHRFEWKGREWWWNRRNGGDGSFPKTRRRQEWCDGGRLEMKTEEWRAVSCRGAMFPVKKERACGSVKRARGA